MINKQRLSASVDADLIEAAENAVAGGRYESVSAWVNEALRQKLDHERRLEALSTFIADYEAAHGKITDDDMRLAARRARERAVSVRGNPAPKKSVASRRRTDR